MTRILIIEDDNVVREMLCDMLEEDGHEAVEATDGEKGILLYRKAPTDLVITDIIMPNKDGIETIMELTAEYPDVKIIAISGGSRMIPTNFLGTAEKFGALRTIQKPFERSELLGAVRELLDQQNLSS